MKEFSLVGDIAFFVLDSKILLSHMDQIGQHINSTNKNIHSYDQMRRN